MSKNLISINNKHIVTEHGQSTFSTGVSDVEAARHFNHLMKQGEASKTDDNVPLIPLENVQEEDKILKAAIGKFTANVAKQDVDNFIKNLSRITEEYKNMQNS